jgi:hypothetical protein
MGRVIVEVRVTLTYSDLQELASYRAKVEPKAHHRDWLSICIWAVVWGSIATIVVMNLLPPSLDRWSIIVGCLLAVGLREIHKRMAWQKYWADMELYNRRWLEEFRADPWIVSAIPQGFGVRMSSMYAIYHWTHLPRIEQTRTKLFVQISDDYAFIIPRACFDSEDDFLTFRELCRKYYDEAESTLQAKRATGITTAPMTHIVRS